MTSGLRQSVTCILVLLGTVALLVLLVVLITGGFVIDAGPLHFSSHRWTVPLGFAAITGIAAGLVGGRPGVAEGMAALGERIDRHAPATALVVAAAAAGTGIGFGTYAASGSDASGYVSQAQLLAAARVSRDEPLARLVPWPQAAWVFSPLGYKPGPAAGEIVPTYPPGLPVSMAAARAVGGEWASFLVVPLLGGLAVFHAYLLGVRLHSRRAGVIAAVLMATSPIFLFQLVQPMSDVPATALWMVALVLALSSELGAPIAAGAAAGFALLVRPNLLPLVAPLALVVCGWPRVPGVQQPRPGRRLLAFAAGLVPGAGALGLLQWRLYGAPVASGHGPIGDFFAIANIGPNIGAYSAWLVRGEWPAICMAVASVVVLLAARRRGRRALEARLAAPVLITAMFGAAVLACYLPYVVFRDWFYLRFFLPVFPLAFVVVGALATDASTALPRPAQGLALVLAVTAAASSNIVVAGREQAFNLRWAEARYVVAGRYLDASLPRDAVVFASQESGSARYYARPIIRWEFLPVDLDTAVATLTAMHRRPVFLVEEWEIPDLRRQFPESRIARLDWRPRADIGTFANIHVLLFDPADRNQPPARVPTDRFR